MAEIVAPRTSEIGVGIGKVRLLADDVETRLGAALGLQVPAAGRRTSNGALSCIRQGPAEWLLVGEQDLVCAALDRVAERFSDDVCLAVDMSDGAVVTNLVGARAVERLAAYCDLDLDPTAFGIDHATRTRFGDVSVTLARLADGDSYWLIGDQSHAPYIDRLLDHGAPTR
ncbi:hypothetical protein M9978_20090 [Sphingomonas sp. MG17]|uniref:Sarcosine oxidase subunit gamma n=1 Tax=Sphingomonas tagetis TaxID=2949092 RepID=A0A9X2HM81_9SPHN|nr:sarcosine oxidase subunit gamma family protein [Sphingomonas tagetis]MCP3732722.1 hypothetical protein [Sphingomonas tagetis]